MKIVKKLVLPPLAGILMIAGLAACEREGPLERAGERVDEAAERAGERTRRAAE